MSFGELRRIIGSKLLCLDNMVSWSPKRHPGGRTSETNGASEDIWRLPPYKESKYPEIVGDTLHIDRPSI